MIEHLFGDKNTLTKCFGAVDADLPALRSFTDGVAPRPGRRAASAGSTECRGVQFADGGVDIAVFHRRTAFNGSSVAPN